METMSENSSSKPGFFMRDDSKDVSRARKTEEFGQLYEQVPVAAAQRALRFWKVRAKNINTQAA